VPLPVPVELPVPLPVPEALPVPLPVPVESPVPLPVPVAPPVPLPVPLEPPEPLPVPLDAPEPLPEPLPVVFASPPDIEASGLPPLAPVALPQAAARSANGAATSKPLVAMDAIAQPPRPRLAHRGARNLIIS
jgi:hypothetical protein